VVFGIDVGSVGEEQLCHGDIAPPCRHVQSRIAIIPAGIDIGSFGQQQFNYVHVFHVRPHA
jgi:hypothetical protein